MLPAARPPDSRDGTSQCGKAKSQFRRPLGLAAAALAAALLGPPAAAQPAGNPTSFERSIAAGYKALMLCGAIFNGGRTQAQAEALELTGIYPEYDAIVPTLKASVTPLMSEPADGSEPQRWAGEVRVPFDPAMPPRIAEWTHDRGCTIQPLAPGGEPIGMVTLVGRFEPFAGSMDARPWPMGEAGIAPHAPPALEAAIGRALAGGFSGRTTGVVVVKDGRIVGERYAPGFGPHVSQRTWSAAKSIAGTLIGIAARDGLLTTRRSGPMLDHRDIRGSLSLDVLLRMASGIHTDAPGNRTDAVYFGGTTVDEEGSYWLMEAMPGTRFRYSNLDTLLAVRALRKAIGDDARYGEYPRKELFAKLGMTRTVAERDVVGNFILSSQVWSTARDLARLGLLWLDDGVWQGERILPEGWMQYMTAPSGPQPPNNPGWGYGATLWLAGAATGLPPGSYAAQGNRGQYVLVVPSRRIVVVRRGEDGTGTAFDISAFGRAVLAALP